jgi:threonine aldolase
VRKAIANAEVGDDVFEGDYTVKKLERKVAEMLGKEAALFVPSGTMANQVSLRTLCEPGDEVICDRDSHIINYEVASAAALSGIVLSPYDGARGRLSLTQIQDAIRVPDIHHPKTRMVALENTHNRAGGAVLDLKYIGETEKLVRDNNLAFYLDGARLWNAAIALDVPLSVIAKHFDMVSVSFSKGLGAPIGSAVSGTKDHITKARRIRKMLGGGMRQVGIIAAAALYAIENNYERMHEDHGRAKFFAEKLGLIDRINIDYESVQTNIVVFSPELPVNEFLEKGREKGLLLVPFGKNQVRAVIHLDINETQIEKALEIISEIA